MSVKLTNKNEVFHLLIKRQSCHHIETSQLICSAANQVTGFYMMVTLGFNELRIYSYLLKKIGKWKKWKTSF